MEEKELQTREEQKQAIFDELAAFDYDTLKNEYLDYLTNFRSDHYSAHNKLFLFGQARERGFAPVFGTFPEWKAQGTSVRRGSTALNIWYFHERLKVKIPEGAGYILKDKKSLTPAEKERFEKNEYETLKRGYFFQKPSIFSISQTLMKENEKIKYLQRFNFDAPSDVVAETVYKALLGYGKKIGLDVDEYAAEDQSALGYASKALKGGVDTAKKSIRIASHLPVNAKLGVAAHELAHQLLKHLDEPGSRVDQEVEAELAAFMVYKNYGIESEDFFMKKYINNWMSSIEKTAERLDLIFTAVEKVRPLVEDFIGIGDAALAQAGILLPAAQEKIMTATEKEIEYEAE